MACERGQVWNEILRETNPINGEGYEEHISVREAAQVMDAWISYAQRGNIQQPAMSSE